MSEAWLNSPCTDPLGRVFARDGRIFRALFRDSAGHALETLEHPVLQSLMQDGLVARMSRSDLKVEGYGPVLEAEKAAFDVPCGRFSFGAPIAARRLASSSTLTCSLVFLHVDS